MNPKGDKRHQEVAFSEKQFHRAYLCEFRITLWAGFLQLFPKQLPGYFLLSISEHKKTGSQK
jgi:hypothetical protein